MQELPPSASVEAPVLSPAVPTQSSPKSDLFTWCARQKVKPPVLTIESHKGGFEGTGALMLPDRSTLTTSLHAASAKKPLEQAVCAELLDTLVRLFGPEMQPPKKPKKPKNPKPTQKPSPEAIAAQRALAKEQARSERAERLRRLLETWSPANARETLAVLRHHGFVRHVSMRVVGQRGAMLLMEAECMRPDGSTVHLMPFTARTKIEGEAFATVQLVESVARCVGALRAAR